MPFITMIRPGRLREIKCSLARTAETPCAYARQANSRSSVKSALISRNVLDKMHQFSCRLSCRNASKLRTIHRSQRPARRLTISSHVRNSNLGAENVPRGDTSGGVILIEDARISAGVRDLLVEAAARIEPGNCVGLVGANGCGKSTLLRCMTGQREIDAGRLVVSPAVPVGYLEQTAVSGSERSVWVEAMSCMASTVAKEDVDAAARAVQAAAGNDAHLVQATKRLQNCQERWEAAGGATADARTARVLNGLGFTKEDWHTPCNLLSGGWQMRVALARLLLSPAGGGGGQKGDGATGGLLLLDEPTNHLDGAAIDWLANYLRELGQSGGSVKDANTTVLVSHDSNLLEVACDRVLEIRGGRLHTYTGGWRYFLREREERRRQLLAEMQSRAEEMAKLEDFIRRFGAKATKASQAQSRQKQLDKLRAEQAEMVEPVNYGIGPGDTKKQSLRLPNAPRGHREILKLRGAEVGWPGASALMAGVDLTIERGQRVVVLGPNGAGKSTLLRALAGNPSVLRQGEWQGGEGLRLGVFEQDQAQALPGHLDPLTHVTNAVAETGQQRAPTKQEVLRALGALGLNGSAIDRTIGNFSGGEKARVSLAILALKESNVLLLDEVSNHLDIGTVNVLTEALRRFDGSIVAITHNKAFAQALEPTHLLNVKDGQVSLIPCLGPEQLGDDAFSSNKANGAGGLLSEDEGDSDRVAAVGMSYEDRKAIQRAKGRLDKVVKLVESKEEKCAKLDEEMLAAGADISKATQLQEEKTVLEEEIEALMEEWENLEQTVGVVEM